MPITITTQKKPITKQTVITTIKVKTAASIILTVNIQTIGKAVNLAAKALPKDIATSIADTDSIANSKAEAEAMTIVIAAATYREVIYVKVTLKAKGLIIDIAATTYISTLESAIFIIKKATSLQSTL